MSLETSPSYRRIAPDDVRGWEVLGELGTDLVPAEALDENGDRIWAQLADNRFQVLGLPLLQGEEGSLVGVEVIRNAQIQRSARGSGVPAFPENPLSHLAAVPIAELPLAQAPGRAQIEFSANPKHDLLRTQVKSEPCTHRKRGIFYLGEDDLRSLIQRGSPVDARIFAALLIARTRLDVTLAKQGDGEAMFEYMDERGVGAIDRATVIARQPAKGITHVRAEWDEPDVRRTQLVRVEHGVNSAPGMAIPVSGDGKQIGLVPNRNPFSGGGTESWSPEFPGGFGGWEKELVAEMGAEIVGRTSIPSEIVAHVENEGFGIDVAVATVRLSGQQQLDETEVGQMRNPEWISTDQFLEAVRTGKITDGRTMAMYEMWRLLQKN